MTKPPYKIASSGLIVLALTGVVLTLPGCGGGGISEGAPFNPAPSPSAPAALAVNPAVIDVYMNTPVSLLISGGVPPYRAFSSNPAILPVLQDVIGSTVTLAPNAVTVDSPVSITVTDAIGTTTSASVNVRFSAIVSGLTITPSAATPGQGCAPAVCSGQVATAEVTLRTATGAPVVGRQVRFDALQGQYNFVLDEAGTQLAKSITVTTDASGRAIVRLRADVGAITSFALIRATDLVTGQRLDNSFPIAQFTDGAGTLTASPTSWKITGPYKGECGSGTEVSYFIFGGTPPYRIVSSIPSFIGVGNVYNGPVGANTTVTSNGGYFIGKTLGGCIINSDPIIFITDATGRTIGVGLENSEGTAERATPAPSPTPTAPAFTVTGSQSIGSDSAKECVATAPTTFLHLIGGGTAPYTVALNPPNTATASGTGVTGGSGLYNVTGSSFLVTISSYNVKSGSTILDVAIRDASGTTTNTKIDCK